MNILALETSAKVASVAILKEGRLIYETYLDIGLTHSETIMPMLDGALDAASMKCSDFDVFAASVGPGSFTGVRIGVATVKGLCRACGAKAAAVNTLDALALNAVPFDGFICPMQDARRTQVYFSVYDGKGARISEYAALDIKEAIEKVQGRALFLGDGAAAYRDIIQSTMENACFAPQNLFLPRASSVALAAMRLAEEGKLLSGEELTPYYLRKPQAQREKERKEGNG